MKNTRNQPVNIPVEKLRPFEGHPFKVKDDEEMNTLIESVQTVGILSPALSHQGTSRQLGEKWSVSQISESANESERQIHRYIRLTNLIPELLAFMDKGKMALSVGVELSYLDDQSQYDVLEQCEQNDCTPSYSQAFRMHKADREGLLTKAVIQDIMCEEKANQKETIKVSAERLRAVLPKEMDSQK